MKSGRNDLCLCGSGRKYKKCCLASGAAPIPAALSPAQLVEARRQAFDRGDFEFIYDSYHCESPFRVHFPERAAYLSYACQQLCDRYRIVDCRILGEDRPSTDESRVLFYLDMYSGNEQHESLELSRFLLTTDGWRYHSGHKIDRRQCPGPLEFISISQVEALADGICF